MNIDQSSFSFHDVKSIHLCFESRLVNLAFVRMLVCATCGFHAFFYIFIFINMFFFPFRFLFS